MTHEYQWRLSFDGGETYERETYPTKDEAILNALDFYKTQKQYQDDYCEIMVGYCLTQDYIFELDEYDLKNIFENNNEDKIGEYEPGISDDQFKNLANYLNAAIKKWMDENKIETIACNYADVNGEEIVEAP